MKSIIGAFIMALLLVCLALPGLVFAGPRELQPPVPSSLPGRRRNRFVEFKAEAVADGQAQVR